MEGTVYERVKAVVVDKLNVEEANVGEDTSFVEDLNADSLDIVELIMGLEEEFSTTESSLDIDRDDAEKIHTIKDVVEYLAKHEIQDMPQKVQTG